MTTSERVQALFAERDREIERLMKEWETERDAAQGAREALKMAQQQAAAQVERLSKQTDAALNMAEIWKDKAVKLAAGQPECERCGGFAILCAKCAAAQREEIIEECARACREGDASLNIERACKRIRALKDMSPALTQQEEIIAQVQLEEALKWWEAANHFQNPAELEVWCQNRLHDLRAALKGTPAACTCDCHKDWTRTAPCANCLDCKFLTAQGEKK